MRLITTFLTLALPVMAMAKAAAGEALTVRVEGLSTASGHVMVALFDKADGFGDDDKALKREKLRIGEGFEAIWVVEGLMPGKYGVALFHDIDDNEVLDTNFVGMPKEPYGFSNNARGTFGPPDYEATTFAFDGAPMTITIQPR